MIITRIARKKSKRPQSIVYVDGARAFDLSDDVLVKFGISVGDNLDDAKVEQIVTSEANYRAQNLAVNYLSYRPRSTKEIVDHLRKKGFAVELAKKVTQHLQKKNLVNDAEFAGMFVRDRLKRKPIGTAMLRQQLMTKGIPPHIIERVLGQLVNNEDQERAAEELATKRLTLSSGSFARLDPPRRRRRLFDYLVRRGFSTDIATKTVRNLFARQPEGRAA